jgi:long-chain acyl-CoA synthetase
LEIPVKIPHLALMIKESAKKYPDRKAMCWQEDGQDCSLDYKSLWKRAKLIAQGLLESGIRPGDRVGIFSDNMPQWHLADFACHLVRAVCVPVYATNTAEQAAYIISDAGIRLIFVGSQDNYDKLLSRPENFLNLHRIVTLEESIEICGEQSLHFSELESAGDSFKYANHIDTILSEIDEDELATIVYTSGTSGEPKGVQISHANLFHQQTVLLELFNVDQYDRSLCFLPLSHVYERSWGFFVFSQGAETHYISDPRQVVDAMKRVRPTVMVSVPRLYEKIYSTIHHRLSTAPAIRQKLFSWAVAKGTALWNIKQQNREPGFILKLQHRLADKLVLGKIREAVGGPKKFFSAGGAPLDKSIEEFFMACGLLICQGYGLTETAPMVSCNSPGDFEFGTVGRVIPGCEVKIADDAEILVRGPNLTAGYWNKPEENAKAFRDGWFHTGDIGDFDESGRLRITDRKKDIIITSGGKNIAPQRIEAIIGKDPWIEQIATIGDGKKFVAALIVPAFEALEEYAKDHKIHCPTREDLLKIPEIIEQFQKRIEKQSRELAAYEMIKRFTLLPEQFTQAAGEITPTLKLKRKVIAARYKKLITQMYEAIDGGVDSIYRKKRQKNQ